jgi:CRP-like cAMP-binding protein
VNNKVTQERDERDLEVGEFPPSLLRRPTPDGASPARNRLLQALAPADRARLLDKLQPVTFRLGDVVCEAGVTIDRLYFPTSAVVSSLYTTEDGATVEMGLAGCDGVVGVSLFLGGDAALHRDVVVVPGGALMMKAKTVRDEFASGGALQSLLLRYTQALITQISKTAVCNRLHGAEHRLCRWLLMCHDRVETNVLQMTQEFISNMLGGRRETITVAARRLQDAGLIRYSRGQITILDRKGLETAACECYAPLPGGRDRTSHTQVLPHRVVRPALLG